jgi:hypothetical protein
VLSANPRSLILVCEEWTHGLNGNKPASQFTSQERGQNKPKFCWRKVFWDLVSNLVQAGVYSNVAIGRVYAMYGPNQPVTYSLKKIKEDKRNRVVHVSLNL